MKNKSYTIDLSSSQHKELVGLAVANNCSFRDIVEVACQLYIDANSKKAQVIEVDTLNLQVRS